MQNFSMRPRVRHANALIAPVTCPHSPYHFFYVRAPCLVAPVAFTFCRQLSKFCRHHQSCLSHLSMPLMVCFPTLYCCISSPKLPPTRYFTNNDNNNNNNNNNNRTTTTPTTVAATTPLPPPTYPLHHAQTQTFLTTTHQWPVPQPLLYQP